MTAETLLDGSALSAAPRLLGCLLERDLGGTKLIGRIVETEAYDQEDVASHSYRGETERTKVMFGPPGHLYVYFTYGMHYCANIVVGPRGHGAAVLIRALEPLEGIPLMQAYRHGRSVEELTNGPAKFTQAFNITSELNGHNLKISPLTLRVQPALPANEVVRATRIGISRGRELPWRFYVRGNPHVSVK